MQIGCYTYTYHPTFVIRDPMNKVHTGKNKSLVSSDNTKLIFKSVMSIPVVCVNVLETAIFIG